MAMDYHSLPPQKAEIAALRLLGPPLEDNWNCCEEHAGEITPSGYKSTLLYFALSPRDKRDHGAFREFLWQYSPIWEDNSYPVLERLTDSQIDYVLDEIRLNSLMFFSFGFPRLAGTH